MGFAGMDLVNDFRTGDDKRAEDILDEIQAVCRKRGALLVHKPDCMILALKPVGPFDPWRSIAQIRSVTPFAYDWRPIGNEKLKL